METNAINRESRSERWRAYKRRPLSLLLRLAVTLLPQSRYLCS